MKILLTHPPQARRQYYGERSLRGLQALAQVKLHEADDALDAEGLIGAAGDVDIIVADRLTEGPAAIFAQLPKLRAFVRCAVDIRNVDVGAASAAGVLVTRAGPGFVKSVTELALGFLVDLSRGISRATADYHAGRNPDVVMGRQLAGSRLGIIGYGSIGRNLAPIAKSLGMRCWSPIPMRRSMILDIEHVSLHDLLARADYVVCLAIANEADREPDRRAPRWRGCSRTPSSSICHAAIWSMKPHCRRAARKPHRRCGAGCRPRPRPDAER